MDLALLDIALRGVATGGLSLLTVLFWTSRVHRYAVWAMTLLTVTTLARLWSSQAPPYILFTDGVGFLRLLAVFGAFSSTFFLLTIFLDGKRFAVLWLGSGVAISVATYFAPEFPTYIPLLRAYAALHFTALLTLILYSARGDLIEARRRVRPVVATILTAFFVYQAFFSRPNFGAATYTEAMMTILGITLCIAVVSLWVLTVNQDRWPGAIIRENLDAPTPLNVHSAQTALIAKINAAMANHIWRQESLTVADLALKVDAPEHRVRKAINQTLGHRNFASFINSARIEEAQKRLVDPADLDTTVLAIAYDVGFASLGPFNRAFRAEFGCTPTEYRRRSLADSEKDAPNLNTGR